MSNINSIIYYISYTLPWNIFKTKRCEDKIIYRLNENTRIQLIDLNSAQKERRIPNTLKIECKMGRRVTLLIIINKVFIKILFVEHLNNDIDFQSNNLI